MKTLVPEDAVVEALARSAVYRFLSLAFLHPADATAPLRAECAAAVEALAAWPSVGEESRRSAEAIRTRLLTAEGEELRAEYDRIFGHQVSSDCPLYETQYGRGEIFQQAQQLADIAGFYLAFGLEMAEEVHERPDHISLELEFMGALAFREAYARGHHGPAEVDLLRDAQRLFLQDHLGRWVAVPARLVGRRGTGFYQELAALAAAVVAADAAAFGLSVEQAVYEPLPALDLETGVLPCGTDRCPVQPEA